jgi:hypothetical protein
MPDPSPDPVAAPVKSPGLAAFRAFLTTVGFHADIEHSWTIAPAQFRAAWEAAVAAGLETHPDQFVLTVAGGQKLVVPAGLVYEDIAEAAEVADKANRRAGLTGREGGYGVARLIPIDDETDTTA